LTEKPTNKTITPRQHCTTYSGRWLSLSQCITFKLTPVTLDSTHGQSQAYFCDECKSLETSSLLPWLHSANCHCAMHSRL